MDNCGFEIIGNTLLIDAERLATRGISVEEITLAWVASEGDNDAFLRKFL